MSCVCFICKELVVLSQNDETHDVLSATGCGHTFHSLCLQVCLATSKTCPECSATIDDSHITNKLYFDVTEIDQRDPAIIDAELNSLKMDLKERDEEIANLKLSVIQSKRECEMEMTEMSNMQMDMESFKIRFISVTRAAFEMVAFWSAIIAKKDSSVICDVADLNASWEISIAELERNIASYKDRADQSKPELRKIVHVFSWNLNMKFMMVTMESLSYMIDLIDDCQRWILDELEKSEARRDTIADSYLAQMEQADQVCEIAKQEISNLRAMTQSEIKTLETSKLVQVSSIPSTSVSSSLESTSSVSLLPPIAENTNGSAQERSLKRRLSSESETDATSTAKVSRLEDPHCHCSGCS